jgi:hypothetical protein
MRVSSNALADVIGSWQQKICFDTDRSSLAVCRHSADDCRHCALALGRQLNLRLRFPMRPVFTFASARATGPQELSGESLAGL